MVGYTVGSLVLGRRASGRASPQKVISERLSDDIHVPPQIKT